MRAKSVTSSFKLGWVVLGAFFSVSLTLPCLVMVKQFSQEYGVGSAISSVLVSNLILWIIGIAVVSMSFDGRLNAIENVKSYLGKYGASFAWGLLIISFLSWFMSELNGAMPSLSTYFASITVQNLLRVGAGLGFLTTLLSVGGIRMISWLTILGLPFILLYYFLSIGYAEPSNNVLGSFGLSAPAITKNVLWSITATLIFPSFFRHARSKADCYLGLALFFVLVSCFEIVAIWMPFSKIGVLEYGFTKAPLMFFATLFFVFYTTLTMNLVNIYYASACWETYVPRFEGAKGFAIIGLMGTAFYTFVQQGKPMQILANITGGCLANLAVVLMLARLVQLIIKHRPRRLEKTINLVCWVAGCAVLIGMTVYDVDNPLSAILFGMGTTLAAFAGVIFVEENWWAVKSIRAGR